MLTLFDYLPSQNAFKVRLLLNHLGISYETEWVSIFEGGGQTPAYRAVNPTGAVPAIRLADGRCLAESNAILTYLADGTRYLPSDRFGRAKVNQWLSFEQDCVQSTIGTLRHWTLTGKVARRPPETIASHRSAGLKALKILDEAVFSQPFVCGDEYTIADMSLFAYASRAEEAGISLGPFPSFQAWVRRLEALPGFLAQVHPYAVDPYSTRELP